MVNFLATSAGVRVAALPSYPPGAGGPPMDVVMVFGFVAAFVTAVVWLHHYRQTRAKIFLFAGCLWMLAIYCFAAGAWPMGIIAMIWSVVTAREGFVWNRRALWARPVTRNSAAFAAVELDMESRMTRMFGPNRG